MPQCAPSGHTYGSRQRPELCPVACCGGNHRITATCCPARHLDRENYPGRNNRPARRPLLLVIADGQHLPPRPLRRTWDLGGHGQPDGELAHHPYAEVPPEVASD